MYKSKEWSAENPLALSIKNVAHKIAVAAMESEKLTELDQQSMILEGQIAEVQSNRKKLLDEIKATEEQLKAWEKKIQVEKEVQDELHKGHDAIDTKGMEKEIGRMKHRLESLVRTQEKLLRDMELAIHKREDIAVKYYQKNTNSNGGRQPITKGELAKKIEQAKSRLNETNAAIREAKESVATARSELSAIQSTAGGYKSHHMQEWRHAIWYLSWNWKEIGPSKTKTCGSGYDKSYGKVDRKRGYSGRTLT